MKILNILSLLLVTLVSYASAQGCRGSPPNPSCSGPRHSGWLGIRCSGVRSMWHYNAVARRCQPLHYWGCGGNNNRWCNRAVCEQRCRR
ncbi:male accessory gland serine protease inhibitor-like [Lucilia cuprina]|uniref:male accessory gland serine protease inhibitor-like n=1 Tax=Lucilia cuprina TaxID=7375 RepID=UPI001F057AF7|nr:male accessory gland serine protease inhibitor-like [Lucilia cuprina]